MKKKLFCAACKQEIKGQPYVLASGDRLCKNCMGRVPKRFIDIARQQWSLNEYRWVTESAEGITEINRRNFTETHAWKNLHLDSVHGLFFISDGSKDPQKNIVYNMKNVTSVEFMMDLNSTAKPFLPFEKPTCYVDISMVFVSSIYCCRQVEAIAKSTKAPTQTAGGMIRYDYPEEAKNIIQVFNYTMQKVQMQKDIERSNHEDEESNEMKANEESFRNALALFMMTKEEFDKASLNDIKKIRNALIRSFHPDNEGDSDRANKINAAYEELKKRK